ncbi:MAG: hypothetical protein ABIO55_06600 [Ginsengibacter sp.]
MEQDKQLKEILLKGSEIASANFTDNIMKRVNNLLEKTYYYQPLMSGKIKKAFLITFAGLVMLILILCLIGAADITFINRIKLTQFPDSIYHKILYFIILFWIVFTTNSFIQKNKFKIY